MKLNKYKVATISIKDRLIIYFLLIYICAGGILVTIIYYNAKSAILDRTSEQLTTVKYVKKKQIESYFNDRKMEIDYISRLFYNLNLIDLKNFMTKYILNNQYYKGFSIISENDRYINESKIDKNTYDEILFKFNNSDITSIFLEKIDSSKSKVLQLLLVKKINLLSIPHYIILNLSHNAINEIMLENNPQQGLGLSGESYLVGNDFLMRSQSRFIENSILKIKVETESIQRAMNNESATMEVNDYRGIKVLSSFIKLNLNGINWFLLAEIDMDEALLSVIAIRRKLLLISIFLSLIIFAVTYIIALKISSPLIKLTEATKLIGKGEFNFLPDSMTNDEISELTYSFNKMTENLKLKNDELNEERLKRFALVMDAQEKEKQRLSKEFHDGLGQLFSALKLKLESIDPSNHNSETTINNVKTDLDDTVDEIRRISNNLMPAGLHEFGIVNALRNLCGQISNLKHISITFNSNFNEDISDDRKKVYIFRIAQEALNNVLKHSSAKSVDVSFLKTDSYKLIISDDGKGFNLENALSGTGNGLYNMKERALSLKGKFLIETELSKGTVIICNIPLVI